VQSQHTQTQQTPSKPLRIGTRGSRLALAQAHMVRALLARAEGVPEETHEIVVVSTAGDRILDRPLSEVGGKGLFTEEIEAGLLDGSLDLAVHSAKDMPTRLPDGLVLTGYLPREDVRDVLVGRTSPTLAELPAGAVVGTASLRRGALVRHRRPDLEVITFRGNVQTRLAKLERGEVDATLLALAGLKRLGLAEVATEILSLEAFPPAVGQGAIAVETRTDGTALRARLAAILDPDTGVALACERAFLDALDGSCRTPIAGLATVAAGRVAFTGLILRPDGSETHGIRVEGAVEDAATLGAAAGADLKARAGAGFFDPA
jgi:hydroxymethylbilane synthase